MSKIDTEARELIVKDFDNTLFVDAGAGSGKTTAMVSRIISVLINGFADVQEIAAITFTNEGAASLKSKIQYELERASSSSVYELSKGIEIKITDEIRTRLKKSLDLLPLAAFSTIHSFCLSLLKERPVEARLDPMFNMEIEGNLTSSFDQAWTEFLILSLPKKDKFFEFLLEYNLELEDIKSMAKFKVDNPDLDLFRENAAPLSKKELTGIWNAVLKQIAVISGYLPELELDNKTKVGIDRFNDVRNLCNKSKLTKDADKINFILQYEGIKSLPKKCAALQDDINALTAIIAPKQKWISDFFHFTISEYVLSFESFFKEYKRKNSALEFTDLLEFTRLLLRNNREVREYFKRKFKFVFIDETQDTDPIQTEFAFYLCEKENEFADDWSKVNLVPSKLFMVGDPKQSIYKFRRADVQVYEKSKKVIEKQKGKILNLASNFRSASGIIEFINNHFGNEFNHYQDEIKTGLQASYVPLEAAAETSPLDKHLYVISALGKNNSDIVSAEIDRIISFLGDIINNETIRIAGQEPGSFRTIQYSDVLILFKNFNHIDDFSRRFEEERIPFYEVGGKIFFSTEDVRGLVCTLKAVFDPTDNVSLYAALKSSIFGIRDKEIFEYVNAGNKLQISSAPKEANNDVTRALASLNGLFKKKEEMKPSGILKKLFDITGIVHLALLESNGQQKAGKFLRLLELCYEIEQDNSLSSFAIIKNLTDIMDSVDPKIANISLSQEGTNAIRLMSIHKSKGLESPVVILADAACSEKNYPSYYYVLRDENKIIIPFENGGFYSKNKDELDTVEAAKSRCENERLRYVACTRAKDILAISIHPDKDNLFSSSFNQSITAKQGFNEVGVNLPVNVVPPIAGQINAEELFTSVKKEKDTRIALFRDNLELIESPFRSIHDIMDIDPKDFKKISGGKGKAFGNVLHRIMAAYVQDPLFDFESILNVWIEEGNMNKALLPDLKEYFSFYKSNQYISEALQSGLKYPEWQFLINDGDKIIAGIIDLVYKNNSGEWIILDYKTDDVSTADRRQQLETIYNKQIQLYADYFTKITGNVVSRKMLLFYEPETFYT